MIVPSSKVLAYVHPDAVSIDVYTPSGAPCRQITIEELKALVAAEYVVAVVRGRKMRRVELTVPPDIAFRQLGETRAKVKDQLHSDANVTTQRSAPTLPSFHKRHHTAHCNAWNRYREPLPVGKTVEGISSDVPRGVGAQRESHLLKRAPEVLAAYSNPAIPVHQIYSRFKISALVSAFFGATWAAFRAPGAVSVAASAAAPSSF